MLMVRLQRVGKKKQPTFRLVLTDSRNSTKSGRSKEVLGFSDPRAHTHTFNKERILYWISQGAKPSGTVNNLLIKEGIIKGKKIHVSPNLSHVEVSDTTAEKDVVVPVATEKTEVTSETLKPKEAT